MKNLYIEIATLLDTITEVKHIDLWSNQIDVQETELPFPAPAVFLEFSSNDMTDIAQNAQSINMQVDVIVMVETFGNSFHGSTSQTAALAFLDLMDKVHTKLHGSDGENFGGMERLSLRAETLGTAQLAYRMTYECHFIDETAAKQFNEVTSDLEIIRGEQAEPDVPPIFDYQ